jgi:hypothetical protein
LIEIKYGIRVELESVSVKPFGPESVAFEYHLGGFHVQYDSSAGGFGVQMDHLRNISVVRIFGMADQIVFNVNATPTRCAPTVVKADAAGTVVVPWGCPDVGPCVSGRRKGVK